MKLFKDLCEICKKKVCKYRCKDCRVVYCSLDCRDIHKCEEVKAAKSSEEQTDKKATGITPNKIRPSDDNSDDDDPDAVRVPKKTLELMKTDEVIRKKLKSKMLRDLITAIDESPQKYRALTNEMKSNNDFLEFCTDILKSIKHLDEHGRFTK